MRRFFAIALLFFVANVCVAQLTDNFSDGDFSTNPVWSGDYSAFIVNGAKQLQLNNTIAGTSYLTTSSAISDLSLVDTEWQMYVKQTFSASGSNYGRVYLISDNSDLTQALNGYYLQFGEAGSTDAIELFRQSGTTRVSVCRGTNGSIASSFAVRVKVVRSSAGAWQLYVDYAGGNNFVLEASGTDASHKVSLFAGVACVYTLTNASKFFYDDFRVVTTPIPDTTPPVLQSVSIVDGKSLDVVFSESLDFVSGTNASNYSIDQHIGLAATASLQSDNKTVRLTFSESFKNGYQHQLSVSGVKDTAGNEVAPSMQPFLYFVPTAAKPKDIIINEFFPDPGPVIGLPEEEFVELYNRSAVPFDLSGWKLTDRNSTATLPSQIILPKEYWIVTASSAAALFAPLGKTIGVSNFPTLNNSGDKIILIDPSGLKVDSLTYHLNWYDDIDKQQGGWTLELLNPDSLRYDSANWLASRDPIGGTPGKQNSQFGNKFDQTAPQLISVSVLDKNRLQLFFDEILLRNSAEVLSNYMANNQIGSPQAAVISADKRSVTLNFQTEFKSGITNQLSVTNISDVSGNVLQLAQKDFLYFLAQPVQPKDIVITEIMADPAPVVGLPEAEYIEIYNRSSNAIDLLNWTVTDGSSVSKFPSKIIQPNEYWILHSSATSQFNSFSNHIGLASFPSLNNSGDSIILKNAEVVTIDSVVFSSLWYRNVSQQEGGWSLELIDPQNDCSGEGNWTASEDAKGGTPARQNSVLASKPDLTGPKLESMVALTPNELLLHFNERLEKSITHTSFAITPDGVVLNAYFHDKALTEIRLQLSGNLATRQLYTVVVTNLRDCNGNNIQAEFNSVRFALPEVADSLDVLVNEILFNPRPNGVDFVEVYNNSPKYINLKSWKVANFENGVVKDPKEISSIGFILPPFTHLALTEGAEIVKNNYPNNTPANFLDVNLPSFPDDEGSVAVVGSDGNVIDHFQYAKSLHSPLLKDDEGVSLERISFQQSTQDVSNWKSASSISGFATPGYLNSNARPETVVDESSVLIEPEVFSPDSGPEFTTINYRFDQSNFLANVKIYDQQGRLIKTIANNESLPYEGFFRWDGDRDDGSKARFGYYMVWFEVLDPAGFLKTFRKRVVVAGN